MGSYLRSNNQKNTVTLYLVSKFRVLGQLEQRQVRLKTAAVLHLQIGSFKMLTEPSLQGTQPLKPVVAFLCRFRKQDLVPEVAQPAKRELQRFQRTGAGVVREGEVAQGEKLRRFGNFLLVLQRQDAERQVEGRGWNGGSVEERFLFQDKVLNLYCVPHYLWKQNERECVCV